MSPRKNRWREGVRTVLFMVAVTAVFGAGVSAVHIFTQARVQANAGLFQKRAVRAAAGLEPLSDRDLAVWYDRSVTNIAAMDAPPTFRVTDESANHRTLAYVLIRTGSGLWGRIVAAVGTDADRQKLTGVAFTEQNETPGLGARITEPWFAAQMRGRRAPLRLVEEKSSDPDPHAIDAITGATITSTAVRDILNAALAEQPGEQAAATTDDAGSNRDGIR